MRYMKICVLLAGIMSYMCLTGFSTDNNDTVLVRVGDKSISVNEFIRRAEFTVRPSYCKGKTNIDKKVILNSLIAEKLLALEAGEDNSFVNSQQVQTFLLGRKEQDMRLFLYNNEIKNKINIDTNRILKAFLYAGREYKIEYVSIQDSTVAKELGENVNKSKLDFEKLLAANYHLKDIPEKKVSWSDAESPVILETLFTSSHVKGEVIGPVKIEDNFYMYIKIKGWTDKPAITEKESVNRYSKIKNTYESLEGRKIFAEYTKKIMKGKQLDFNKNVFLSFSDIMGPLYMPDKKERQDVFKNGVWNYNNETMKFEKIKPKLDEIRKEILFTIDNQKWTVDKFLTEIKRHPLVFRTRTFPKNEFGLQFQLAILDMVRDSYLTAETYARGYDKLPGVTQDVEMWKDHINALNGKYQIIEQAGQDSLYRTDYMKVLKNTLNPKIDLLQKKYSDKIFVNTNVFNKIKITGIDMAANYANLPFSQVVPNFPVVTTDNKLDYGKPIK